MLFRSNERRINVLILLVSVLGIMPLLNHFKELTLTTYISKIRQALIRSFEEKHFTRVADMDYSTLENPDVAVQQNRLGDNAPKAPVEMLDYFMRLFGAVFGVIAVSSIIASLSPLVIVMMLIIVFVNSMITKLINKRNYKIGLKISEADNVRWIYFYNLTDYSHAKEIRIFNAKDFFIKLFIRKREEIDKLWLEREWYGTRMRTIHSLTNLVQQAVLYAYAIYRVLFKNLPIGTMTIFISAASQFLNSLNYVFQVYLEIGSYCLHAQELLNFMELPMMKNQENGIVPKYSQDSVIEFRHVYFKYPNSQNYAIKDLNLKFHYNEKLCIVGENGSGKTTFVKLLTRLYDPTEGEILLNGININKYDYTQYQHLFAPAFQDFSIFDLPLASNISLSNDCDADKLNVAIERSGLSNLVNKLPKGTDTYMFKNIDKEGIEPSGGEEQKISIARAIYYDAPIYILDEPTAALDPIAEYEIYSKFNNVIGNRTALLITHRMSAVQLADVISVFKNGELVEYGTHKELYVQGGVYTEMFDKQAEFYRDVPSQE